MRAGLYRHVNRPRLVAQASSSSSHHASYLSSIVVRLSPELSTAILSTLLIVWILAGIPGFRGTYNWFHYNTNRGLRIKLNLYKSTQHHTRVLYLYAYIWFALDSIWPIIKLLTINQHQPTSCVWCVFTSPYYTCMAYYWFYVVLAEDHYAYCV